MKGERCANPANNHTDNHVLADGTQPASVAPGSTIFGWMEPAEPTPIGGPTGPAPNGGGPTEPVDPTKLVDPNQEVAAPLTTIVDLRLATSDQGGHPLDEVVRGIAARNANAYARLYDLMADRLYALAHRMLGNRDDAEDAVQQTFLELARGAAATPQKGKTLEGLLFASVRRICLEMTENRAYRSTEAQAALPEIDGEDLYDLGLDPHLESALNLLTPEQRLVVHLKHVEGLDGNQIAEITGRTRMAVYAMATRAERRLRRQLSEVRHQRPRPPHSGVSHG